jgi:hypothetical protein
MGANHGLVRGHGHVALPATWLASAMNNTEPVRTIIR